MTFYEELQQNQAGSKKLIRESKTKKEKYYHMGVYGLKILLTIVFCMAFVVVYSMIFGSDNSIAGVMLLLCVMVFRSANFGYKTSQALVAFLIIFTILAVGPHLANMGNPFLGFLVNVCSIGIIVFLGCYNVRMFNHSTLVLGYLLLYGYDVSGAIYGKRVLSIVIGGIICCFIYYRNHHKKEFEKSFKDLFKDFNLRTFSTQWQITLTLGVSSILLILQLLDLQRSMWAGAATMSILSPIEGTMKTRAMERIPANIVGGILCYIFYTFFPGFLVNNIGLLGGIGVGLSASYGWQSLFNAFGAISVAVDSLGLTSAIFFRILNNVAGILYGMAFATFLNSWFKRLPPENE